MLISTNLARMSCIAIVAVPFLGCGRTDGLARVVVTGNVRLRGTPVEFGQIRFIPQGNTKGPVTIEEIRNGTYTCQHSGGVPAGQHRVEILAWDPNIPIPTGPGQPQPPQLIPEQYNTNSKLTVTIDNSSNGGVQDFDL